MIPRKHPKITVVLIGMAFALTGCVAPGDAPVTGDADPSGGSSTPEMRIRGEALVGKDGYGLTPCGSDRQRILALSPQARIFLDVWAKEKDGKLEVATIERAHTEGPRCDAAREEVQFVASGTEPFWSLELSPAGWVLQRPDSAPLQVQAVATKTGKGYAWISDSPKATVELTPGYCADAMADAASAWQARVSLGELRLSGCAHRGELPLP